MEIAPNLPESVYPRVVIIGGGFGGINLAKSLKKKPFQVVLIDKHNYHLFQPLLYQVATAGLEPSSIAFPIRGIVSRQENFYFRLGEVKKIDPDKNIINTSIGPVHYDYLVIATGSENNFFGNPHFEAFGIGMKSLPEAVRIRNYGLRLIEKVLLIKDEEEKKKALNFVITGGGPTGVELAGALAEFRDHILTKDYPELKKDWMNIYLVEGSSKLLAAFGEASSTEAYRILHEAGVKIYLETRVKDYDGEIVYLDNDEKIPTRSFIWSAGVKASPVSGLLPDAIEKNGRIKVNEYNQVRGYENIFAIGDVAQMIHDPHFPKGYPMLAQPAIQQGKKLAFNLVRLKDKRALEPFLYKDKGNMATIGRNHAIAEIGKMKLKGFIAWFAWMFVHLLFLMGFRNKLIVFINWMYGYFTYDRGTRIILKRDISDTEIMKRMVLEEKNKTAL
jgi:NADH:quinone reductase (non-electrogenic)